MSQVHDCVAGSPPPGPAPRPPRQRRRPQSSAEPVSVVVAGVQQQRARARSGDKPAFKLANKTSMNLDGPGYALTLLLVGGSHSRHKAENITHFFRSNCHFGNGIYERARREHHHVKISGEAAPSVPAKPLLIMMNIFRTAT